MSGHGWVNPRPDGAKARCGGPGICGECSAEQIAALGAEPLLRKRSEEEREAYFIEKLAELVTARREASALKDQLDQAAEEIRLIKEQRDGALELAEEKITELKAALKDLLEDTQHAGHDCGDTPENCPVLNARETLARYEKSASGAE